MRRKRDIGIERRMKSGWDRIKREVGKSVSNIPLDLSNEKRYDI